MHPSCFVHSLMPCLSLMLRAYFLLSAIPHPLMPREYSSCPRAYGSLLRLAFCLYDPLAVFLYPSFRYSSLLLAVNALPSLFYRALAHCLPRLIDYGFPRGAELQVVAGACHLCFLCCLCPSVIDYGLHVELSSKSWLVPCGCQSASVVYVPSRFVRTLMLSAYLAPPERAATSLTLRAYSHAFCILSASRNSDASCIAPSPEKVVPPLLFIRLGRSWLQNLIGTGRTRTQSHHGPWMIAPSDLS